MRARPALTLAVIAALCLGLLAPAIADTKHKKHQVDAAMKQLANDLDETSASLRQAASSLHNAEAKLPVGPRPGRPRARTADRGSDPRPDPRPEARRRHR